jgi:hypothetical protein
MTVSLVGTEADRVLWSRSFERLEGDVLTLQREAAQAIAQALQVQLTPQETARLSAAAPKVNPEAFALYLKSARGEVPDGEMSYIEQEIAKASTFALAHAMAAHGYIMAHDKVKAERAIAKALALDPNLSDAYDALGMLRQWIDRDWLRVGRGFPACDRAQPAQWRGSPSSASSSCAWRGATKPSKKNSARCSRILASRTIRAASPRCTSSAGATDDAASAS